MKYFANLAISSRSEWDSLRDEVENLKRELSVALDENANLHAKLEAYETGCVYGGEHCEACKKSRKVEGLVSFGFGQYKTSHHVCILNVPCSEFEPKEEAE